eukprot:TRINITY_DN49405_c0_g1_i1.p1 TRINITY_DN49405_c0_g1~~TRINITY_DN49405_c0_g1_i1.p1  ORF type:complete len:214 (-),score=36.44 TRINITY_DN49405_c0_g1_i1:91-732(-)
MESALLGVSCSEEAWGVEALLLHPRSSASRCRTRKAAGGDRRLRLACWKAAERATDLCARRWRDLELLALLAQWRALACGGGRWRCDDTAAQPRGRATDAQPLSTFCDRWRARNGALVAELPRSAGADSKSSVRGSLGPAGLRGGGEALGDAVVHVSPENVVVRAVDIIQACSAPAVPCASLTCSVAAEPIETDSRFPRLGAGREPAVQRQAR